jgi:KipI family sensor histidine kinase inhibitor
VAEDISLHCAGEGALIAYPLAPSRDAVFARVRALATALPGALGEQLVDLVPSYDSLLVIFDALGTDHFHVAQRVRETLRSAQDVETETGELVSIPVCYDETCGPDLAALAARAGLGIEDVIALHSATEYRVYAIGFAPGFAYLGEVDERIAAPRLSTPRERVPRGAVAIADRQTAVYPAASPGGWNLIGRSPTRMFDPGASPPMPVRVGDRVRFTPVDRATYLALGGEP